VTVTEALSGQATTDALASLAKFKADGIESITLSDTEFGGVASPSALNAAVTNGALTVEGADGGVTIDAATFTKALVLNGGDGVDVITGGSGNDTITGGAGADVIDLGSGTDTVVVDAVTAGGIDVITNFRAGDVIKFVASTTYLDASATDFDDGNTTLADALADVAAAAKADSGAANSSVGYAVGFVYGGDKYVYIDGADDGYAAAQDAVIKLVATDLSTLTDAPFIG
jgi:Ca2+-binding RTX toxin-like protein